MILIYPQKKLNNSTQDEKLYNIAEYLKKYILERGGSAIISRKGWEAPDIPPTVLKETTEATVFLGLYTGDYVGGTYLINCDNYSSLVGTINNVLKNTFGNPRGSGINITGDLKYSSVNDIELHIPDSILNGEDIIREKFAATIVEAAFNPPVKNFEEDLPSAYNTDPYFYKFLINKVWYEEPSMFKAGKDYNGSYATIIEDIKDPKHPIRLLEVTSNVTGNYTIQQIGERKEDPDPPINDDPEPPEPTIPIMDNPIPQHYTWRTDLTNIPKDARKVTFYAKGTGKIYVKIGKSGVGFYTNPNFVYPPTPIIETDYTEFIATATPILTKYTFELNDTTKTITSLEIGVQGTGKIMYTMIYINNNFINDTEHLYPKGYRDSIPQEYELEVPTTAREVLSAFGTMEGRAGEKINKPIPEPLPPEEPKSASGGESPASPKGFSNILRDTMSLFSASKDTLATIQDIGKLLKVDTTGMGQEIKDKVSYSDKQRLANAKNRIESMKKAAEQEIVKTEEAVDNKAQGLQKKAAEKTETSKKAIAKETQKVEEAQADLAKTIAKNSEKLEKNATQVQKENNEIIEGIKDTNIAINDIVNKATNNSHKLEQVGLNAINNQQQFKTINNTPI